MDYDLVIIGGGIVGLTLANAICHFPNEKLGHLRESDNRSLSTAKHSFRIAIVDPLPKQKFPSTDEAFDLRVSTLSLASYSIMEKTGIWARLPADRIQPFSKMNVWDRSGEIGFDAAMINFPMLGFVLENNCLAAAMAQNLENHPQISWHEGRKITAIDYQQDTVDVILDNNQVLRTSLVVGADGGRSAVRKLANIPVVGRDIHQRAIVANVGTQNGHQQTAWQRFLPTGPLAFLPLRNGESAIVWSYDKAKVNSVLEVDDDRFRKLLGDAFEYKLGEINSVSKRRTFPLNHVLARRYLTNRIALIGDAAHSIHPLAGQGVNLGLLDAAALAQVLLTIRIDNKDIGGISNLRVYERWRKGHNQLMAGSMLAFNGLFSNSNPILMGIRNLGLFFTNQIDPAKHLFVKQAVGMDGDVPLLAKFEKL